MGRLMQQNAMNTLTMISIMSILKETMFEILVTVLPLNILNLKAVQTKTGFVFCTFHATHVNLMKYSRCLVISVCSKRRKKGRY